MEKHFFPLQNAVLVIKSHTNNNEQPPPSFALWGADGMMDQRRPGKVFPLSSAQGALRGPTFYECVKCLVDALHLIYDHNNNGAAGLRKRPQPRENKIWKHKAWERNVILQRLSGGWDTRGVEIKGREYGKLQTAGTAEGFIHASLGLVHKSSV